MTAETPSPALDQAPIRTRRGRGASPIRQLAPTRLSGGRLAALAPTDPAMIHAAVLQILATTGLSEAPPEVVQRVCAAGGRMDAQGRLLFPPELVEAMLADMARPLTLYGRAPGHDLDLGGALVHVGSGGAAPLVVDLDDSYRASTLRDLYDAARLVDALENVHFFSRSLVARDMSDALALDVNTAYASLAGTRKHVMVAAQDIPSVRAIAQMCHIIAGTAEAFRARPFLSLNVNHVVPPLRFSPEACTVLAEATRLGIPVHVNTFGQMGASSPVTIAGCVAQTLAETLAGMVFVWLVDPAVKAVFGVRPMVTDLRTGGIAGGAGEQALLTATCVQLARYYGLPNSTIAGASDSKISDAQSGYEKSLSVALAAHAGANLITQACGMQAGLMAASFESYVVDNEMLGAVLRSLAPVEVNAQTLSPGAIDDVARGEGHFLGQSDTLARMETDFLYPVVANRQTPDQWLAAGSHDLRVAAKARAAALLAGHFPDAIPADIDAQLRARFDIHLPAQAMRPG